MILLGEEKDPYTPMATEDIFGWLDTDLIHVICLNGIIMLLIFIMLPKYKCKWQNQKTDLAANEIPLTHRKYLRLK